MATKAKTRWSSTTPKYWKIIRNISGTAALIAGALLTAPIALPAGLALVLPYIVAIGGVLAPVAQTAKE